MIDVLKYNLPDINILDENQPDRKFNVWQPDKIYLILGQSNTIGESLNNEQVEKDEVAVYKRPSGGQTVILTANTLVISTTITAIKFVNPDIYFTTGADGSVVYQNASGNRNCTGCGAVAALAANGQPYHNAVVKMKGGYLNAETGTDWMKIALYAGGAFLAYKLLFPKK